jgi:hypothetical protein
MVLFSSSRCFAALVAATALIAGGCSSVYQVTVAATSELSGLPRDSLSFSIHHQSAGAIGALRQKEITTFVKTALSARGLYEARDLKSADMIVDISYGMGPPRTEHTVEQTLVNGRPMGAFQSLGLPPEGVAREVMGYTPLVSTTILREKYLSIHAHDNRQVEADRPAQDLWRVDVRIEDESDDLRGHLPVLIAAAMDHIGRTTDGEATLAMHSDDEAVRFVRKGLDTTPVRDAQ